MSWYEESLDWIDEQQSINPEMTRDELKNHCRKNYPFAMRKGWAYKAWLRAMQERFGKRDNGKNKDLFKG